MIIYIRIIRQMLLLHGSRWRLWSVKPITAVTAHAQLRKQRREIRCCICFLYKRSHLPPHHLSHPLIISTDYTRELFTTSTENFPDESSSFFTFHGLFTVLFFHATILTFVKMCFMESSQTSVLYLFGKRIA